MKKYIAAVAMAMAIGVLVAYFALRPKPRPIQDIGTVEIFDNTKSTEPSDTKSTAPPLEVKKYTRTEMPDEEFEKKVEKMKQGDLPLDKESDPE